MHELQDVKVDVVSLVDRAAVRDPQNKSEPRTFLLYKSEGSSSEPTDKGEPMNAPTDTSELSKEELDKFYKAELDKAQEEIEKLQARGGAPDDDEDPVNDADHDGEDMGTKKPSAAAKDSAHAGESETSKAEKALLERVEKAEKDAADRVAKAEKDAADATKIAKEERDRRELNEWIEKTDEAFVALPIQPSEFGPLRKRMSERLSSEDVEKLDTLFQAADVAMSQSQLFKEAGRGGVADGAASDPISKVMRKAEEIQKSDSNITASQALAQALSSDPQLEREYLLQERGSVR